jgi:hypothetical protein
MEQRRRTHRWAFPLGVLLIVLAVVGAVTLVRLAAGGVARQLNHSKDKERYEKFLAAIVVQDPDPFDSAKSVPMQNVPQLLNICLWVITQPDDAGRTPDGIPMDDDGNLMVPQKMVEDAYQRIFGTAPPTHMNVEGSDFDFLYDDEAQCYRVPVTGSLAIYFPRVKEIVKKTGNSVELTVEYLAYNDFKLDARGRPEEPEASKVMTFILYETPEGLDGLQVGSIRQFGGIGYVPGMTQIG